MINFANLRYQNKKYIDRLNLPDWQPTGSVFVYGVDVPYNADYYDKVDTWEGTGIHQNSCIQVIRQICGDGVKIYATGNISIQEAVDYCIEKCIRIISASYHTSRTDETEAALKLFADWGGIFIAAAGNTEGKPVNYPASSQHTIGVSATNVDDCDGPQITVTADSCWIVINACTGGEYPFGGTSCATPVITACARYILDARPNWKLPDVVDFITNNSTPLTEQYERFFRFHDNFQKEVPTLKDIDQVSSWAKEAVQELHKLGIVTGDGEGNFNPKNNITREENAVIAYRILKACGVIK